VLTSCRLAAANTSQKVPLVTNFDPTNSPYQGCFAATGLLGQPTLNGASLLSQPGLTDQVCRSFCVNTATGHPYLYFGISNGVNCFCGNTPPQAVAGLPNEALCTVPNSGDPTQAGGAMNAINVWLASPIAISPSSGLPGGLPSGIAVGLPSLSLPLSLPIGVTSAPLGGMSSGLPNLQSIISSQLSLRPSSGVITLPTITAVPSNAGELSSLLSVIGNLPSGFSLPVSIASGVSQPVSVPGGTGLPSNVGQLSSMLSLMSNLPSGAIPSGGLPSGAIPSGGLPSGVLPSGAIPSGGLPSGVLPSGVLPSGAIPSGGLPSGAIPSGGLPSGSGLPSGLPSGVAQLSSLISAINAIPSSVLPSGFSVPVISALPSNGAQISSIVSVINNLPSGVLPSGVSIPASSGLPTNAFSTVGVALPAVTPVGNPALLTVNSDPASRFVGCLAFIGLNGLPILNGPAMYSPTITQASCNAFCNTQPGAPYRFYALEQGNLCHCAQSIDTANVLTDATGCNMAAEGDPTQLQNGGGRGRLATFQNTLFPGSSVRPFSTILCSKLALHKIVLYKVGIG
jgi:hypothetical protein